MWKWQVHTVHHDLDVADIRVKTGEDRKIVNGGDRHIVKSHKLGVLHLSRES